MSDRTPTQMLFFSTFAFTHALTVMSPPFWLQLCAALAYCGPAVAIAMKPNDATASTKRPIVWIFEITIGSLVTMLDKRATTVYTGFHKFTQIYTSLH